MLSPAAVASTLLDAAESRTSVSCFTDADEAFDPAAAYAAQDLLVARRVASGETLVGAKLGLTSRAKQVAMGVDEPLYGWLTSGMVLREDAPLDLSRYLHPRVEPEIAFVLGRDLAGPATIVSVLAATEWVCPALEVIDSRYSDFRFALPDVIADNASAAGFVLGGLLREPAALGDLRLAGCVTRVNGEVVATAAGAAVMGHPAQAVAWLADRLGERGRVLPAGSIVLSGALTNAFAVTRGSSVDVEIEGLGHVGLRA